MISYAIARNCNKVLLLYPYTSSSINTQTLFEIPSLLTVEKININVQSLDITFEDINEADIIMRNRIEQLNPIFNS
jgi:hypothetical protein